MHGRIYVFIHLHKIKCHFKMFSISGYDWGSWGCFTCLILRLLCLPVGRKPGESLNCLPWLAELLNQYPKCLLPDSCMKKKQTHVCTKHRGWASHVHLKAFPPDKRTQCLTRHTIPIFSESQSFGGILWMTEKNAKYTPVTTEPSVYASSLPLMH